jgi:hypothetical protein
MPGRRPLDFDRIGAIMPDVDRLLEGHTTAGHWTLGEVCDHLARAIRLTLIGRVSPDPATPEQEEARRAFFRDRAFPEGRAMPVAALTPDPGIDPHAAAESLRESLARLESFQGHWPTHRILGPLTRDEWLRFHCIHCAHHLSFARPS